ncbi:hypothetical protein FB471_0158 [Amycolatopsis cihanbeyliensis]|uniref:Uncharacterized protein n=1 Tax=Amycolatopsis cihanbeyliensis TaxID=1128664 RepID=A0A542DBT4_AMYCI|nr:hypothetical protein FB471_0158 [Amycolatopsis cihanbeyliensis]
MAGTATRIRTAAPHTVRGSTETFLDTIGAPNTRRSCGIAIVRAADTLDGPSTDPVGSIRECQRSCG